MLLEMKKHAGLASPDELAVLDSAMLLIGGSEPNAGVLAVHVPCKTLDEWVARHGEARYDTLAEMTAKT